MKRIFRESKQLSQWLQDRHYPLYSWLVRHNWISLDDHFMRAWIDRIGDMKCLEQAMKHFEDETTRTYDPDVTFLEFSKGLEIERKLVMGLEADKKNKS
jgi:hypothetical protein